MKKLLCALLLVSSISAKEIVIGAKKFTEGNISAHIVAQILKKINPELEIKILENLGGTGIVTSAIVNGEIDFYVDYTGTLVNSFKTDYANLKTKLDQEGIVLGPKLGFNNSYGLAVKNSFPISSISELKNDYRLGISHEFFKRNDGYSALKNHYGFSNKPMTIEHALLYNSLNSDNLDIIEVYTTDAKIKKYDLKILRDDKDFFPRYDAVVLANKKFLETNKDLVSKLFESLNGKISNAVVTNANYLVEIEGRSYSNAASTITNVEMKGEDKAFTTILPYFLDHLKYLIITVFFCVVIGVPLGTMTAKNKTLEKWILSTVSVFQTIPSLALLVFLIPLFGLGELTTLIALVIYGLLPVVKSTHTGIKNISKELLEFSDLIRMSKFQKFWLVEIPLAKSEILTGIKITCTMTIGVTVIAAFVGAGGLGSLIVTGLSLNDIPLILKGAVPAAALALVVEFFFIKILPLFSMRRG